MISLKLAYRNLVGAGLRTWLNVGVLSFIYVLIIWHQGLFSGMYSQASRDLIADEVAGGQYWHRNYDPFDPWSLEEAHGPVPEPLRPLVRENKAVPILIRQGTIFPQGRVQSVLIRGIEPDQSLLDLPTAALKAEKTTLPIMVGRLMAQKNSLKKGDLLTLRWRDVNGTFDAADGEVVEIMRTNVPTLDQGQLWVPLADLRRMSLLDGRATLIVMAESGSQPAEFPGWEFKGREYLLRDIVEMVRTKRLGGVFIYAILLFLAVLAVFDTQVLSIFRRRKEIGTLMALGMTRTRVVGLFTLEGALHGILAIGAAAVYGIPILVYSAGKGIPIPGSTTDYGLAISTRLFPLYSAWLVMGTVAIIMLTVTVVSYLPSRKISHLNPTEALKGKLS